MGGSQILKEAGATKGAWKSRLQGGKGNKKWGQGENREKQYLR